MPISVGAVLDASLKTTGTCSMAPGGNRAAVGPPDTKLGGVKSKVLKATVASRVLPTKSVLVTVASQMASSATSF